MASAPPHELAFPHGSDPDQLARALSHAHDLFVETGATSTGLRDVVVESWRRCLSEGVDPESAPADVDLDEAALEAVRAGHPLSATMPLIRRLLVESATEAGLLVAVSDSVGRLLWVEGSSSLRSRAEGMTFLPGANWSEARAGTNAPGTALALDRPVQIFGAEHLARPVTPWSCSAAPIHDPDTGAILGVLDLTGGPEVAAPQSLSLVRATVAAVESELRIGSLMRHRLDTPGGSSGAPRPTPPSTLRVLGARSALLGHGSSASRLSLRHSEMLLLLASAPDGLSSAELAVQLSEVDHAPVTVRAELSRLRSLIKPLHMQSRPYRLAGTLRTDADAVRESLRHGQLRQAVSEYRGPVLPHSQAPGVVRLRRSLHDELRAVLVDRGDPDALLGFADTEHGRDDLELWQAVLASMPASSPRRSQVLAHLARLDADLT
ncbi:transcriptional regulator [Solicola sp. PLA-1-18]|uniref:transcriptional regulator n=1 Tax=Solicola sp. PLA-1-18 TaxID=3380532 RepID=UPI003B802DF9